MTIVKKCMALLLVVFLSFQICVLAYAEESTDEILKVVNSDSITDEWAKRIARCVYERANKIWELAIEDEAEKINRNELDPEKALTNLRACNFLENTSLILDKYNPYVRKMGIPKVISHEEFDKQSVGKKVFHRGVNATDTEHLSEYTEQLLSGKFKNGIENSGIFASTVRYEKDKERGISSGHKGIVSIPSEVESAESHAHDTVHLGRIFSFFYDPETTRVVNSENIAKIINEYYKLYAQDDVQSILCSLFDEDGNCLDKKQAFLLLCYGTCPTTKLVSLILGAEVCRSEYECQVFDPGVITFDAYQEDFPVIKE